MATTVVTAFDSDGYEHMICAQSQQNTCGAASLFMIECYVKQMSMAAGEDGVRKYLGRGEQTWAVGIVLSDAVNVLKSFGCKPRIDSTDPTKKGTGVKFRAGRMGDRRPALVAVRWLEATHSSSGPKFRTTGGHAVVARYFTEDLTKIVVLDPWGGGLVELLNNGKYRGPSGEGVISDIIYT